jgi:antitoxin component YwqK of YwqJK toxin-antitoxin module
MPILSSLKQFIILFVFPFLNCIIANAQQNHLFDTTIVEKNGRIEKTVKNNNTIIVKIIRLKNNLLDGKQETYLQSGKKEFVSNYKQGNLEGEYTTYDNNEMPMQEKNYQYYPETKKSELNGAYKSYEKGNLVLEVKYKNGLKNGNQYQYHNNGAVASKCNYTNDLLDGSKEEYTKDNKILSKSNFIIITQNGKQVSVQDGAFVRYDYSGNVIEEGAYIKGIKEGVWKKYAGGKLEELHNYKNGKQHGEFLESKYGKIGKKGIFYEEIEINGKLCKNVYDGTLEVYTDQTIAKEITNYKMGKKNGLQLKYYNNDTVYSRTEFKDDLKINKVENFSRDGQKIMETNYIIIAIDGKDSSVKNGKEIKKNNGKTMYVANYANGQLDGENVEYDYNGNKTMTRNYKNNLLSGKLATYYLGGKVKTESIYHIYRPFYGPEKSEKVGWEYQYTEEGFIELSRYTDSISKPVIYFLNKEKSISKIEIDNLLEVNYFAEGNLQSMIIKSRNSLEALAFYFTRTGKIRKISFENADKKAINHIEFNENEQAVKWYGNTIPDSTAPAKETVDKIVNAIKTQIVNNAFFIDSIKKGKYILQYANNKKMAELNFANNLPDGDFVFYDAIYGDTIIYKHYTNGFLNGKLVEKFGGKNILTRKTYYNNGSLKQHDSYTINGEPYYKIKYNAIGIETEKEEYQNNKLIRYFNIYTKEVKDYYLNGKLMNETNAVKNDTNYTVNKSYFENSQQLKSLTFLKNGYYDSVTIYYFKNGKIQTKFNNKNGKREGLYTGYDETGSIKLTGEYINDLQEGMWLSYNKNKTDTTFFNKGKQQVKLNNTVCSCIDTAISNSKMFLPGRVANLLELSTFRKSIPPYIRLVDSLNFNYLFYINSNFNNSQNQGNANLKLLLIKETNILIPADEQIKICLNPCLTPGYFSAIDAEINYGATPLNSSAVLFPKKISLEMMRSPMKSADKNYPNYKALFGTSSFSFYPNKKVELDIDTAIEPRFTKGILNNFLTVEAIKGQPRLFNYTSIKTPETYGYVSSSMYYGSDDFFGLLIDSANTTFNYLQNDKTTEIKCMSDFIAIGSKLVKGRIKINCKKTGIDDYTIQLNKKPFLIQSQLLKMQWLQKGFIDVGVDFDENSEQLIIDFNTKQ